MSARIVCISLVVAILFGVVPARSVQAQAPAVNIGGQTYYLASHLGPDTEGWYGSSFCGKGQIVKVYQGTCQPWYPSGQTQPAPVPAQPAPQPAPAPVPAQPAPQPAPVPTCGFWDRFFGRCPKTVETAMPTPEPADPIVAGGIMPSRLPADECGKLRTHMDQRGHITELGGDKTVVAIMAAMIAGRTLKVYTMNTQTIVAMAWSGKYIFLKWGSNQPTMFSTSWEYIKQEVSGWKEVTGAKGLDFARQQVSKLLDCYRSQVPAVAPAPVPAPAPQPVTTPVAFRDTSVPAMGQICPDGVAASGTTPVYFLGMDPVDAAALGALVAGGVVVIVVIVASGGSVLAVATLATTVVASAPSF